MNEQAGQQIRNLEREHRLRAMTDLIMVAISVYIVCTLASSGLAALLLGISTLSVGIVLYIIRRGQDAITLASANEWRLHRLADRGISLSGWHQGEPLPDWVTRNQAEDEDGQPLLSPTSFINA